MREPQFVERTTDVSTLFICLAAKLLTDIQEEVADMDTLSNVNEATSSIPCSGLTPAAIPPAKSSQTGVSVEYVPDANKNWYVLRASYGRELLAEELLIQSHAYAYVAKQYRYIEVNGRPKRVLDNMISNLVFAYLSPSEAIMFVKNNLPDVSSPAPQLVPFLSFYYDHFSEGELWRNPPLTVPEHEMLNFIRATCTHDENLLLLQGGDFHYKTDDEVEVIAGQFKGVRGRVIRARGQQRVLIKISQLNCLCATAYIPSAFLQKV